MNKIITSLLIALAIISIEPIYATTNISTSLQGNSTYTQDLGTWYSVNGIEDGQVLFSNGVILDVEMTVTSANIPMYINGFLVTEIGDEAFYDCTELKTVKFPSSITTIGEKAFQNCTNISIITLPNSVTTIKKSAFLNCSNLISIDIPTSVFEIGASAFRDCSSLTSFTIPNTVTTINERTFYNCINLHTVIFSNNITNISDYAFYACKSLSSILIPDNVENIGNYAFTGCNNLVNLIIPINVSTIGELAFASCTNLNNVLIPSNVTNFGKDIFYNSLDNLTIYGNSNTPAQSYANLNYIKFSATIGNEIPFSLGNITVTPSNTNLVVNGQKVELEAYKIDGNNFIKLRDLASMINNTDKNFQVSWNNYQNLIELTSNTKYTYVGGELSQGDNQTKTASLTTSLIYLNGEKISCTAYKIDGNNYFKLRDIMEIFDVYVGFNNATSTAWIDTSLSYTG